MSDSGLRALSYRTIASRSAPEAETNGPAGQLIVDEQLGVQLRFVAVAIDDAGATVCAGANPSTQASHRPCTDPGRRCGRPS
jgi:hypothetical protein